MNKVTITVLIILFATTLGYISVMSLHSLKKQESVSVVYRTEGFSGFNTKIPEKEIESVFDKAKTLLTTHADKYRTWELITTVASWAAFFFSGVIALIAGYIGIVTQKEEDVSSKLMEGLKAKSKAARFIGVIAALATLLSGISVRAKDAAQDEKAKAVEIRDTIIGSYKDLQNAESETDARQVIEKLRLVSEL